MARDVVQVRLVGGFQLVCCGTSVAVPPSTERVLALLALRGTSSRSLVAGALWPDRTEGQASACLRTALWRTRKICRTIVTTEGASIRLGAHVDIDVTAFLATARQVVGGDVLGPASRRAVELLHQDLLPGWNDEWVIFERDRLRQLGLHALETLAVRLSALGRHRDALEVARRAVAAEPLRESARRTLAEVHLAAGDVGAVHDLYEEYRRALDMELGLEPSVQFDRLLAVLPETDGRPHRPAPRRPEFPAGPLRIGRKARCVTTR